MAHVVLQHMDWPPVVWTALSWLFASGILYLVYQFGHRSAIEHGLKISSWRTIALLLGFVACVAMFVTDRPDQGLVIEFGADGWAVFLGIFLTVTSTYVLGYTDSIGWARSRYARAVSAPRSSASL